MKRWAAIAVMCLVPVPAPAARYAYRDHSHLSKPCQSHMFEVNEAAIQTGDETKLAYEGSGGAVALAALNVNDFASGQTVAPVGGIGVYNVYLAAVFEPDVFHSTDGDSIDLCASLAEADKSASTPTEVCLTFDYGAGAAGAVLSPVEGPVVIGEDQSFAIEADNVVDNGTPGNSALDALVTVVMCPL